MRKSWDEYYLSIAEQVAEDRPTCNRLQVGCVIVKNNRIVSTGFNGSIKGHPHCNDVGCLIREGRCIRTLHAEENAILQARREDLEGATAYVTHECCDHCTKRLNQSGVVRVVFRKEYPNEWNKHFIEPMEWVYLPKKEENK